MHRSNALILIVVFLVTACGGSGGSKAGVNAPTRAAGPPPVTAPQPPPAAPPLPQLTMQQASRFAAMATFGLDYDAIAELSHQGRETWLERQMSLPVGDHTSIVDALLARAAAGEFVTQDPDGEYAFLFRRMAWWHRSVTSADVLRQRVAFALSEIFVASDNVDALLVYPEALSSYYDILLYNAFGNYRDLLRDVTLNPAMGLYLSHLNNRRSIPQQNIFPDENYAREVMQLFSIGLFELDEDGSQRLDKNGAAIPTYGNTEIREFAKIFTGLTFAGNPGQFPVAEPNFRVPMQMVDSAHEPGEKFLLNGQVVPAGQTGMQDIEAAIDNLFAHPNVGPFIGRLLIKRLVTSNPSPAYVARVAQAFADNGAGVRGDMAAVVRAILLDPEANASPDTQGSFGKLREPVVRDVALMRQLGVTSDDGYIFKIGYALQTLTGQHPLSAFSVFNFYLPDYVPPGELATAGLTAPEMQITTSSTIVAITNLIDAALNAGFVADTVEPFAQVSLDMSEYYAVADNLEALIDRLDIVFTAGTLSAATRFAIRGAASQFDDPVFRTHTALYLVLISPDYAVRF